MTEEEINKYLTYQTGLPLINLQKLLVRGRLKSIKRKQLLAQPGQLVNHSYFLIEGIVRHFVVGKNKSEFTKHFMKAPDFLVASIPNFFLRTPDSIRCEAITDLSVIEWAYDDLINFGMEYPKIFHFLLKCVVKTYQIKEKKELALHQLDAKERYEQFLDDFPGIAYEVPLRYIASYLNIRPETLSRIRALK